MFIMTEKFGIINFNHYQRIAIISEPKPYHYLYAFGVDGDTVIVSFDKNEDAENALLDLFHAIEKEDPIWDARAFKKPK